MIFSKYLFTKNVTVKNLKNVVKGDPQNDYMLV